MKRRLPLLIALALATGAAHAGPATSPAAETEPVWLRLSDLATAFAVDGTRPASGIPQFPRISGHGPEGAVLWLTSQQLADPAVRQQASIALQRGDGVLVERLLPADRLEASAFGFQMPGKTSLYYQKENGSLDITVFADDVSVDDAMSAVTRQAQARQAARFRRLSGRLVADDGSYTPTLRVSASRIFPGGRRIAHDIVVMRDVSRTRDEKVVMVKTQVDQAAEWNGLLWDGDFNDPDHPYSYTMFLPDVYRVSTSLRVVGGSGALSLETYQPEAQGATEFDVNESVSIKASKGVGLDAETAYSLAEAATTTATTAGKLPIKFTAGTERTETRSISMTLKDYYTFAEPMADDVAMGVAWKFPLATHIANDYHYFDDGRNPNLGYRWYSKRRFLGMMERAALETASTWRIKDDRGEVLQIRTDASVTNRVHESVKGRSYTEDDDKASTIAFTSVIDLSSPHLARQPAFRLASKTGQGCLAQPDPAQSAVVVQACEKGEMGLAQQWTLEVDGTYRNSGSRACLTADESTGDLHVLECVGYTLNQQWFWSADRLHSKVDQGHWRLHLREGRPNAMFDATLHDRILPNEHHPLLNPWTQYPLKPQRDFEIPQLVKGRRTKVYEAFLAYREVSTDQRWTAEPVRTPE